MRGEDYMSELIREVTQVFRTRWVYMRGPICGGGAYRRKNTVAYMDLLLY